MGCSCFAGPSAWVDVSVLVAIAGPMGSGKTSIASALAETLKGRRISFGEAVRAEALRRSLPVDRKGLQDFGESLIREGWPRFIELVFVDISEEISVVVVDGVRHHDALAALRAASDKRRLILLYIHADADVRRKRLASRDSMTAVEFDSANAHPNEREVHSLRALAEIVVDNSDKVAIEALVASVKTIAGDEFLPRTLNESTN